MKALRYLKYLDLVIQIIDAIERVNHARPIPVRLRFDVKGRRWTLSGSAVPDEGASGS